MRIASLDDDTDQLDLIKCTLSAMQHDCHTFTEGSTLLRELQRESFDLLVLDWQLPDMSGPDVVRWVRHNLKERIPILFVTNQAEERDIVEALNLGADDFIAKPVGVAELAARVRALLRRAYAEPPTDEQVFGRYRFLIRQSALEIDGKPVQISRKEFDLALFLFRNIGRLISRKHLLESIWNNSNPIGTQLMSRSLDTHISRVRANLGLRPENGYRLTAIYGQGYRFEAINQDDDAIAVD